MLRGAVKIRAPKAAIAVDALHDTAQIIDDRGADVLNSPDKKFGLSLINPYCHVFF